MVLPSSIYHIRLGYLCEEPDAGFVLHYLLLLAIAIILGSCWCWLGKSTPGWIVWHRSRQMNDLSFQKSPDKSQISYFLLCNYIGLFIPVAILELDRLFKHAQSHQLAGDKGHTILLGEYSTE